MRDDSTLFTDINTPEYKAFSSIERFVWSHYSIDKQVSTLYGSSKVEKNAKKEDQYKHTSLISLMAYASVEVAKGSSAIYSQGEKENWFLYQDMLDAIDVFAEPKPWIVKHYELFYNYAMDQVKDNLKGGYPVLLKLLLCSLPVTRKSMKRKNTGQIKLWEEIKKILEKDLKDYLLKNKKMANNITYKEALLPNSLKAVVSQKTKTVRYYWVDRLGHKKPLELK